MRRRSPSASEGGGVAVTAVTRDYLHGEVSGQTSHRDVSRGGPIGAVHLHLLDVARCDPAAAALLFLVLSFVLFVLAV